MIYYLLTTVLHLLLLVHSETIETNAAEGVLQCNVCADLFNWTRCDGAALLRTCSDQLVRQTHDSLANYNPRLNETGSSESVSRQFHCFRLKLEIDVSSVNVFIRGCTYDDTDICDGWSANGAKAINCATCSTEVCERNATWDVLPMSTTAVSSTTSTTPVAIVTTTTVSTTVRSSSTEPITKTPSITTMSTTTPSELSTTPTTSSTSTTSSTRTIITTSPTAFSTATESTTEMDDGPNSTEVQTGVPQVKSAFNCTECASDVSWEHCLNSSQTTQCTTAGVNEIHSILLMFNPNLPVGNYMEFKCFKVKASFSVPKRNVVAYAMGCTFASTRFCSRGEWHSNVTILECSRASLLIDGSVIGWTMVVIIMIVFQLKVNY